MIDTKDVAFSKERILDTIKNKGPSLPVHISKVIDTSLIFASAFLSELIEEGQLKVSTLRVGSSPLYFLPGQEDQLENFTHYLAPKEKEAFQMLKDKHVLIENKIEPAMRIALRSLKDFAVPMTLTIDGNSQLIWKYFSFQDEEVEKIIKKIYNIKDEKEPEKTKKIQPEEQKEKLEEKIETERKPKKEKKKKTEKPQEKLEEKIEEHHEEIDKEIKEKQKKNKILETQDFHKNIKEYLSVKDIELLETILEKKKEIEGRIRINTLFGKQEFYLIAKEKKTITENDITTTQQKAQTAKLPALIISSGELNKKAKNALKPWNNLIKFEKLDLE